MADIIQWAEATDAYESPERANSVIEELVDEIERLRNAVDVLLREIGADHRPNSNGRGCWWCMSTSWPCVHRMVLDQLKEARRG